MKKRVGAFIMAIIFATAVTGMATAKTIKCNVETIENGKVMLDCGKKADKLKIGTVVKVKTVVKRKAVEGC